MNVKAMPSDAALARLLELHPKRIDLVLDRIKRLLAALGHPEEVLPPVIHVAGTNGKGSVCAFLRSMLEGSGQRVHLYISPHLIRFHERIRLAGLPIGEEVLFLLRQAAPRGRPGAGHGGQLLHRPGDPVRSQTGRSHDHYPVLYLLPRPRRRDNCGAARRRKI